VDLVVALPPDLEVRFRGFNQFIDAAFALDGDILSSQAQFVSDDNSAAFAGREDMSEVWLGKDWLQSRRNRGTLHRKSASW